MEESAKLFHVPVTITCLPLRDLKSSSLMKKSVMVVIARRLNLESKLFSDERRRKHSVFGPQKRHLH